MSIINILFLNVIVSIAYTEVLVLKVINLGISVVITADERGVGEGGGWQEEKNDTKLWNQFDFTMKFINQWNLNMKWNDCYMGTVAIVNDNSPMIMV